MNDTPALLIDPPLSRPVHWDGVQRVMRKLKDAFVNPYQLLVNGFRDAWMMRAFLTYVRAAEAEARRGLLCDALEIIPALPAPEPRPPGAAQGRSRSAAPEQPPLEADFRVWPARFQVMPPSRTRAHAGAPNRASVAARRAELQRRHEEFWFAPAGTAHTDYALLDMLKRTSLRACALRFEAVRRVMENPAPHALRLARRLKKQADAALARAFLATEPAFDYDHHDEQRDHCGPLIDALWPAKAAAAASDTS
jgi:hypothetical protein